ncbi:MAG: NADAR family protein [Saprospiraceae bacterium]|uniref:NADAR family protein n=1 Tax=Candidatus Opimibacter skivensis TaxID=2982028 RepID=A0A9D7XPW5_9BACT|nr:NADAR family protein [Candidatus Opimibacter skivensis]
MKAHYDINWLKTKLESGDTLKYVYFWGHTNKNNERIGKFCFSQWFECPFIVDNITYKTSEHWMMAHKALLFGDKVNFEKIINCNKPGEAKELGRQVSGYDDRVWQENKFEIVKLGNIHKFNQHPPNAEYLLKTDDRILVEASPVDTIWGIGLSQDSKDIDNIYAWRGENLLGFVLMETRDFLKEFGHFAVPDRSMSL